MIRYSKSSGPLLKLKRSYFEDNEHLLQGSLRICQIYVEQPRRARCKNCDGPLGETSFTKQGVEYVICERCGHLNGGHEDTDAFCKAVYTEDGGANYARTYAAEDAKAYRERVHDIYVPKAEFLCASLREEGLAPEDLSYADLGAGSGYFVAALRKQGLSKVTGYEVSESQARLANAMVEGSPVRRHVHEDTVDIARSVEAEVVSMIGVLEHVQRPRQVLAALRNNSRLKYVYISVPLFSPCVFFEMVFPTVMNRQLTAGHTHLYTESSLDWMCHEFDFERTAEWWFGTDMVDLYRSIAVRLSQVEETSGMIGEWTEMFVPVIDSLQVEFDKKHLSSEVHMVLKAKR